MGLISQVRKKKKKKDSKNHAVASYSCLRNEMKTRCLLVQILFEVFSVRTS